MSHKVWVLLKKKNWLDTYSRVEEEWKVYIKMDFKKIRYDMDWQFAYLKSDYAQGLIRNIRKNEEEKKEEDKPDEKD